MNEKYGETSKDSDDNELTVPNSGHERDRSDVSETPTIDGHGRDLSSVTAVDDEEMRRTEARPHEIWEGHEYAQQQIRQAEAQADITTRLTTFDVRLTELQQAVNDSRYQVTGNAQRQTELNAVVGRQAQRIAALRQRIAWERQSPENRGPVPILRPYMATYGWEQTEEQRLRDSIQNRRERPTDPTQGEGAPAPSVYEIELELREQQYDRHSLDLRRLEHGDASRTEVAGIYTSYQQVINDGQQLVAQMDEALQWLQEQLAQPVSQDIRTTLTQRQTTLQQQRPVELAQQMQEILEYQLTLTNAQIAIQRQRQENVRRFQEMKDQLRQLQERFEEVQSEEDLNLFVGDFVPLWNQQSFMDQQETLEREEEIIAGILGGFRERHTQLVQAIGAQPLGVVATNLQQQTTQLDALIAAGEELPSGNDLTDEVEFFRTDLGQLERDIGTRQVLYGIPQRQGEAFFQNFLSSLEQRIDNARRSALDELREAVELEQAAVFALARFAEPWRREDEVGRAADLDNLESALEALEMDQMLQGLRNQRQQWRQELQNSPPPEPEATERPEFAQMRATATGIINQELQRIRENTPHVRNILNHQLQAIAQQQEILLSHYTPGQLEQWRGRQMEYLQSQATENLQGENEAAPSPSAVREFVENRVQEEQQELGKLKGKFPISTKQWNEIGEGLQKEKEAQLQREKEELERKKQEELERKKQEELERKKQEELERKKQEELERKKQEELERKQKEEQLRQEKEAQLQKEKEVQYWKDKEEELWQEHLKRKQQEKQQQEEQEQSTSKKKTKEKGPKTEDDTAEKTKSRRSFRDWSASFGGRFTISTKSRKGKAVKKEEAEGGDIRPEPSVRPESSRSGAFRELVWRLRSGGGQSESEGASTSLWPAGVLAAINNRSGVAPDTLPQTFGANFNGSFHATIFAHPDQTNGYYLLDRTDDPSWQRESREGRSPSPIFALSREEWATRTGYTPSLRASIDRRLLNNEECSVGISINSTQSRSLTDTVKGILKTKGNTKR